MKNIFNFSYQNHDATVILPQQPNGEWIWKTEFLYAFDQAECALLDDGFTRVYYSVSDRYGSPHSIRLMHNFYQYVIKRFSLKPQSHLFGFSRGGLYAFNFALFYPEYVASIYLDAPVLDMKSWPLDDTIEQSQMLEEYTLNKATLPSFKDNPINNLEEFFRLNIPLLIIAGAKDSLVSYNENTGALIDFCSQKNISINSIIKPECDHHPHSLEDVTPIINFIKSHCPNINNG